MKHWNKLTTSIKALILTPIALLLCTIVIQGIEWLFKNGYFETVIIGVGSVLAFIISYCVIYCLLED